ncbi:MAG: tripartite tricarboxylate transporter substrate-binding protein [Syntrophales bacterium]|jgi:tripartite-type tricarboxylate transporter receptor subunit TctC|nr:tripartite tricarboxylate transporter substrate-binding protein [Syntrophales bacterium]
MKRFFCALAVLLSITLIPQMGFSAAPFYEGKTITIMVGYSAGGGFDNVARIISRHMPKYIPGKPAIIVENVTGAGGLICANRLYKATEPDGLTIAHISGGILFAQALKQPGIEFDARKFGYLGSHAAENAVLWVTKESGIKTLDQLMASKTPVKLGGTGKGSYAPDSIINIWKAASPIPVQLITPYKGGSQVRLAAEGKELAGSVLSWDAMKSAWKKRFDSGDAVVIMQAVSKAMPDLPKIPTDMQIAKTDEGRQLIEVGIHLNNVFSRPFVLGPGVPKDRVDILRTAFDKTMKDKEFIAECEKARLPVSAVTGQEIEKAVMAAFDTPQPILTKLSEIVYK